MTCPSAFRAATRADRMGATTVWGFVASGTCRLSEWQTPARPKTVRVERLCAPIPFVFCEEKTKPYNPYRLRRASTPPYFFLRATTLTLRVCEIAPGASAVTARFGAAATRSRTLGALIRAPTVREGLPPTAQYHAVRDLACRTSPGRWRGMPAWGTTGISRLRKPTRNAAGSWTTSPSKTSPSARRWQVS